MANSIGKILNEAAEKHLPRKSFKKRKWMTNETLKKIEKRKERKRLKNRSEEDYEAWTVTCKEVKKACNLDRDKYLEEQCEKVDERLKRNDSRGAFELIKGMIQKKSTGRLACIKDETGKTLTESDEVLERWKRYCEKMYSDPGRENNMDGLNEDRDSSLAPLCSEVEWAIKSLKDGKSAGCDNICAEMIKASGAEGVKIYHQLCGKIWKTGIWPIDWKRSIYIPLPKTGDLKLCPNYRTIALISHASKILLKILMNRIKTQLEEEVNRVQAGFREGRGTRDHILNLNILIQKCRDFNTELRICFIDYSKAFDCVKHQMLWKTLAQMGLEPTTRCLIRQLYEGQQAAIKLESGQSEWFQVEKGVRQGCILSPYLFSIYTESIMRDVDEDERSKTYEEPKINGEKIKEIRYADDTALLSKTEAGLEKLVDAVKEHSESRGLQMNVKKTKILDIDTCENETAVRTGAERIENVNSFEYLGSLITNDGDCSKEVKRRLGMASIRPYELRSVYHKSNINTKLKVVRTCIFPIASYGCEAWTISKSIAKRINAFEFKCYRAILGVHWSQHRTNDSVANELGVIPGSLMRQIKKQKLKYYGHIARHECLEGVLIEGRMEGKRRKGRPCRKWHDDIKDWLNMDIYGVKNATRDRNHYRLLVGAATSPGYAT